MSRNIAKTGEFKDSIFWRAICDCTSNTCDLELLMELDEDFNHIILDIGGDFVFDRSHLRGYRLHCRIWRWLKAIFKLIFTGRIEVRTDFILGSEDQITDFIAELTKGLQKIIDYKKSKKD